MNKISLSVPTLLTALLLPSSAAQTILNHNSTDDVFLRESEPDTIQADRNIFGGQGDAAQFVTLMKFSLSDLSTDTSGDAISITSVSLSPGTTLTYSGISPQFTSSLHSYTDFDATTATWNNPDGDGFGDTTAGGSLGSALSTELFTNAGSEGSYEYSSSSALIAYLQSAYENGDSHVYFRLGNTTDSNSNGFLRTDQGSSQGTGTAALTIDYVSAVPEPSSSALLGLGGLSLILRRRK